MGISPVYLLQLNEKRTIFEIHIGGSHEARDTQKGSVNRSGIA